MLKKKTRLYLLAAILLAGFALRFLALQHGYPPNHPDEPVVWSLAYNMIKNRDLNPHRFDYPMFSMMVNAFGYLAFFIPLALTKVAILHTGAFLKNLSQLGVFLDTYVLRGEVNPVLFWGRWISVLWGTGTILVTYFLASEAFGSLAGLITAFLLAVNYRHLIASTLTLPDVFNTFLQTTAFFCFLLLLRRPSRKLYILAGILIGLVFATKYQAMIILPYFLVAFYRRKLFTKDFFLSLVFIILVFFLVNPYILIKFREAYRWIAWDAMRYEVGVIRLRSGSLWYLFEIVLGKPLSLVVVLGAFLGLIIKKYRLKTLLFLSFLLAFFFMFQIYTHGGIYGRNYTVLMPFMLSLAALGIIEISKGKIIPILILTGLVSLTSIKNSFLTAYWWSKDWNHNCAKGWMLSNLPKDSKVGIVPPTPMDAFSQKKATWVFYEPKYDFTLPELQENKIDYVVINLDYLGYLTLHWLNADKLFWEMPIWLLDNSLTGLTLKEVSRYTVKACLKPWQVPDHNFLIVKVPPKQPSVLPKLVKEYAFDEKDGEYSSGWQVTAVGGSDLSGFSWEKGKTCKKGGCLKTAAGRSWLHQPARFVSKAIPVIPGKKYLVEGWIKSESPLISEERNGFLRVDFYENQDLVNGRRGITTAVSGRVWQDTNWQKKWLETVAPSRAKFMRISLQHESAMTGFWFDEIKVFQAEATKEEKEIANRPEIDSHYIYSETIF